MRHHWRQGHQSTCYGLGNHDFGHSPWKASGLHMICIWYAYDMHMILCNHQQIADLHHIIAPRSAQGNPTASNNYIWASDTSKVSPWRASKASVIASSASTSRPCSSQNRNWLMIRPKHVTSKKEERQQSPQKWYIWVLIKNKDIWGSYNRRSTADQSRSQRCQSRNRGRVLSYATLFCTEDRQNRATYYSFSRHGVSQSLLRRV